MKVFHVFPVALSAKGEISQGTSSAKAEQGSHAASRKPLRPNGCSTPPLLWGYGIAALPHLPRLLAHPSLLQAEQFQLSQAVLIVLRK